MSSPSSGLNIIITNKTTCVVVVVVFVYTGLVMCVQSFCLDDKYLRALDGI